MNPTCPGFLLLVVDALTAMTHTASRRPRLLALDEAEEVRP